MLYQEAVRYLLTLGRELASPSHARAQKFDLRNITVLAERLGHLHRAVPCVDRRTTTTDSVAAGSAPSRAASDRTPLT